MPPFRDGRCVPARGGRASLPVWPPGFVVTAVLPPALLGAVTPGARVSLAAALGCLIALSLACGCRCGLGSRRTGGCRLPWVAPAGTTDAVAGEPDPGSRLMSRD